MKWGSLYALIAVFFAVLLRSQFMLAQCNCPSVNSCGPCQGGLTSLTLRYDGTIPSTITVKDNQNTYFVGSVNPGASFIVQSTAINEKFQGNELDILVNSALNTTIDVNCSNTVFVNSSVGSFVVLGGASKQGGALCCATNTSDAIPPEIINCPKNIEQTLVSSECSVAVSWTLPAAFDNCGIKSFVSSHSPGEKFPLGTTTITYTASDNANNSTVCQFTITVSDINPPVISRCPADVSVELPASACSMPVSWRVPEAADNCSLKNFSASHNPGSQFQVGTTDVEYTASDEANNISTCRFRIIVNDVSPPVFTSCPDDIVVTADNLGNASATWEAPVLVDNCNSVNTTSTHTAGSIFSAGTTLVEYTALDDYGNLSTCHFNVFVATEENLLEINQLVTPDGDGSNDVWTLGNIDKYPENEVMLADRWGNIIFTGKGYDNRENAWSGRNNNGKQVPTGTYFYIIKIRIGIAVTEKRGFIELIQ